MPAPITLRVDLGAGTNRNPLRNFESRLIEVFETGLNQKLLRTDFDSSSDFTVQVRKTRFS
jgi:hypothetical protein